MTFAISLSQILNKIVHQLKTAFQKLDQDEVSKRHQLEKYLCSVGELVLRTTLGFTQNSSVNSPL
jgi:protein-arginine kinase